jgi:PAS domain S-box-containing protein
MSNSKKWFLLQKKTLLIFSAGLIIAIVLIVCNYHAYEAKRIKTEKYDELKAIANLKSTQISEWYSDEIQDAELIIKNPILIKQIREWVENKTEANKKDIEDELFAISEEHNYSNIALIDKNNINLVSLKKIIGQFDSVFIQTLKASQKFHKVVTTDIIYDKITDHLSFYLLSPVNIIKNQELFLVLEIDPEKYLYPLIRMWPTSSKTSETILARRDGDSVLLLGGLKYKKNLGLGLKLDLSNKNLPAARAVLGDQGLFEGKDYRGVEVLAELQKIKATNWYLIAKVDDDEIYAELNFRTWILAVQVFMLFIFVALTLIVIYSQRQKNIYKELYLKEKELWESKEEFRITLYSIGDGVITTDIDGLIKRMNAEAERLTGWTEGNARGRKLEDVFFVINENSRERVDNPVIRVLKEGIVVGLANHTLLISKNGKEIPIADSGAPIKDENGNIFGVVLVFQDQTKPHEAQKALEESEERLRIALQASKQCIYDYNIERKEISFTQEYLKLFGYKNKHLVFPVLEWYELIHPEDRDALQSVYKNYVENDIYEYRVEFRQIDEFGNWKWILSLGKIFPREKNGAPERMLGTYFDITELKKNERELIAAKEKAENSEKIKSEFLAQMSHEIRSPINVILSYVDLIRTNFIEQLNNELIPGFDSITLAGKRIIRTIDLILNMSDLHLGTYDTNNKKFDIEFLINGLIKEYSRQAENKKNKILLKKNISNTFMISDEYAVNQIFANLIDNAVKYTNEGSITIFLSDDFSGNTIVRVEDTGIGISDQYMPFLFTAFSQEEHGYTRKFDGNGLGLSLVKKYCDLLDAEIKVESKKDKGTVFTVVFPAKN